MNGRILFVLGLCAFLLGYVTGTMGPSEKRVRTIQKQVTLSNVQSLPFGIHLKKVTVLDLSAAVWPHVFKIPHLPMLPRRRLKQLCARIPSITAAFRAVGGSIAGKLSLEVQRMIKTKNHFCAAYEQLDTLYQVLHNQTANMGNRLYHNMMDLATNKVTGAFTEPLKGNWQGDVESMDWTFGNSTLIRHKRQLDFIGNVFGGFFGLATQEDVEALQRAVTTLYQNQAAHKKAFETFKDDIGSVLDVHWGRMDLLSTTLNDTLLRLQRLDRTVFDLQKHNTMRHALAEVYRLIIVESIAEYSLLQDVTMMYVNAIQNRITAISWLNQHYLTPELVDTLDLKRAYDYILPILNDQYAPFRFAVTDHNYYYSVPSTSYTSDSHFLYVQIKIPLTVTASHYHVFEVYSVPMKAGDSKYHYTQLKNLPKFVAFSIHGDTYTTFDQRFLNGCVGKGIKRCDSRVMEVSTGVPSCILGLFLQDLNMTTEYCETDLVMTTSLADQALDIGKGQFFVTMNPLDQQWVINCPNSRPRTLEPCTSCVISLDCRCNLKTTSAFISASLQECSEVQTTSGLNKTFVPNLSWLTGLEAANISTFRDYNMTTRLLHDPMPDTPTLPLPDFSDISEFTSKESEIRTSLDQVLKQISHKEPVYLTKLQEFHTKTRWYFFKIHHALPLSLTALTWCLILTLVFVYFGRQYCGLVAVLKNLQTSGATPIHSEQQSTPTIEICVWYITIMLTFYISATFIFVIYKQWTKHCRDIRHYPRHSHDAVTTQIYLKIWNGVRTCLLEADELCVPLHDLNMHIDQSEKPELVCLNLRYSVWKVRMQCYWAKNKLKHKDGMTIPLPEYIKVPRKIQHLAYQIMKDKNYMAAIVLKTGPMQATYNLAISHAHLSELSVICRKEGKREYEENRYRYKAGLPPIKKTFSFNPLGFAKPHSCKAPKNFPSHARDLGTPYKATRPTDLPLAPQAGSLTHQPTSPYMGSSVQPSKRSKLNALSPEFIMPEPGPLRPKHKLSSASQHCLNHHALGSTSSLTSSIGSLMNISPLSSPPTTRKKISTTSQEIADINDILSNSASKLSEID